VQGCEKMGNVRWMKRERAWTGTAGISGVRRQLTRVGERAGHAVEPFTLAGLVIGVENKPIQSADLPASLQHPAL
jgi:hypothetical protein